MEYNNSQSDFITRTKEIIKQYERGQIPKEEKYEITLLLNCLVGLLIIPQQKWYKELPTEIISERIWGIDPDNISAQCKSGKKQKKTVKNIATHLRNSIAHYSFGMCKGSSGKIDKIKFEDFTNNDKTVNTFETEMSIDSLRKFTDKLTEFALSKIRQCP
ncbi:hypothetical protein EZS27_028975 [termite gut metagenome]|uniref:pEK499-p136 HEPN domain-containing protein n=1 Tax=termite gut metagenome TaxID=433724 RepID=A0A5J4QIU9_9ZZZZ